MQFLTAFLACFFYVQPALALCCSLTPQAQWFVDSVAGSDASNGTSATTPLQTIAALLGKSIVAGDCIALKKGSTWREQLTLPADRVCVATYGTGNAPLLDASDAISGGAWTKTGGRTNIYQADLTFHFGGFPRIWENDASFTKAADLTALDSAVGYFFAGPEPFGEGDHVVTMYVHATSDGNPASNGKTYEYNSRGLGVFSQFAGNVVSNVRTRRNLANNGSFELGINSIATDITAQDGTKHNALMHGGGFWRYATMTDSYYNGQSKIALVIFDATGAGRSATLHNCSYTESVEAGGTGFYSHTSAVDATLFGTTILKNCSTSGLALGSSIAGFAATEMIIDGGTFHGPIVPGSTNNIIRNVTASQITLPYPVIAEIDTVTLSGDVTNGLIRIDGNASLNIHDSDFSNTNDFDGAIYVGDAAVVPSLTLLRNIFRATVQTNHIQGGGNVNLPASATINNNTYHYPGASSWMTYRGVVYDISAGGWAAWQALGFDANGSRVTP